MKGKENKRNNGTCLHKPYGLNEKRPQLGHVNVSFSFNSVEIVYFVTLFIVSSFKMSTTCFSTFYLKFLKKEPNLNNT